MINNLFINTASTTCSLALLQDQKLIDEVSWESQTNESEKVLAEIKNLLFKNNKDFKSLSAIVCVNGPGSYTRLRIGVVIANALAFSLQIPGYEIDQFSYFELRAKELSEQFCVIINAGANEIYISKANEQNRKIEIKNFEDFLNSSEFADCELVGDLTSAQEEILKRENKIFNKNLLTFGQSAAKLGLKNLKPVKIIKPFYIREVKITERKQR